MFFIVIYVIFILIFIKLVLKAAHKTYDGAECLVGKVAVITGGNRGIGFEVAKCLAARGCKIILACRSKAENERKQLVEMTHNENIIVKHLDLNSFETVRSFAKEIHKTEKKIDILINNAGVGIDMGLTTDGLHPVVQTNIFSPFLLTHLLIDLLKKSNDGRIIFSSSIAAFLKNNLTLKNLNPNETHLHMSLYAHFFVYCNTKLAQIIVSNYMSEKLKKYGIKSNAVHPGIIKTDIWHGVETKASPTFYEVISKWALYVCLFFYSRTPQEGAQGIVEVATSDHYKDITGNFFWGFGMSTMYPNPRCLGSTSFCKEIWKKIESFVKLKPDEML